MTDDQASQFMYGIHAVRAALRQAGLVKAVWVQAGRHDGRIRALIETAEAQGIPVQRVARRELRDLVQNDAHQGIVARTDGPGTAAGHDLNRILEDTAVPPLLLALDGVQDPHNLGACLRTAAAAGVHAVIAPRHRCAGITPVVRKVASGAVEQVPFIQVPNLARALAGLQDKGIWTMGADSSADTPLYDTDMTGPIALVMGGEGKGLRRLTRRYCDLLVSIPLQGQIESLNISVATGICLFEALRQRRG